MPRAEEAQAIAPDAAGSGRAMSPEGELIDTTPRGFALTALGALAILGVVFLYTLVLHPWLGFGDMATRPLLLTLVVMASSVAFMGFILVTGPSMMSVYLRPAMPFTGRARTLEAVRAHNDPDYPFELVETDRYDLLLRYKLEDATWRGRLFRGGVRAGYWLYVRLDEETRTAWMVEKTRTLRWDAGLGGAGPAVRVRFSIFYGIILSQITREVVLDPADRLRKVADMGWSIAGAREPVMGVLLRHGWKIRYRLLPLQVRKP